MDSEHIGIPYYSPTVKRLHSGILTAQPPPRNVIEINA